VIQVPSSTCLHQFHNLHLSPRCAVLRITQQLYSGSTHRLAMHQSTHSGFATRQLKMGVTTSPKEELKSMMYPQIYRSM